MSHAKIPDSKVFKGKWWIWLTIGDIAGERGDFEEGNDSGESGPSGIALACVRKQQTEYDVVVGDAGALHAIDPGARVIRPDSCKEHEHSFQIASIVFNRNSIQQFPDQIHPSNTTFAQQNT